MSDDCTNDDGTSARVRSRVSNGTSRLLFGDGRSAGARRYRDLRAAFAADLGEPLSAGADQVVRRLAQVSVELELQDAARAAGEPIDPVAYCSMVNVQRRLLRDLDRLKAAVAPPGENLHDYLASKAAEAVL